jgi:hypothetical protein
MPERKTWGQVDARKKDLIFRLQHAEEQHDFYSKLYRQYLTDLLRLNFYVREMITNELVAEYLKTHHGDILARFTKIIFDAGCRDICSPQSSGGKDRG